MSIKWQIRIIPITKLVDISILNKYYFAKI